jgi:hypothetical protein
MQALLTGNALWSYDFEVSQRTQADHLKAHTSGFLPFHTHEGKILLSRNGLFITGDVNLIISLNHFDQLYLGFDETFPRSLAKNFGWLWQPLRKEFTDDFATRKIYLIIDYNMFGTKNKIWFDTIKQMFSSQ